jgi:hypothetical protein
LFCNRQFMHTGIITHVDRFLLYKYNI